MRLSRISVTELRRRPGRTLLTFLGDTIGVATVVAIPISIENTRGAFGELFDTATGSASLEVVREGNAAFDLADLESIRGVHGVDRTVEGVQSAAALMGSKGPYPLLVIGVAGGADQSAPGMPPKRARPTTRTGPSSRRPSVVMWGFVRLRICYTRSEN